jgi:F-type H+-transporting ATPase subunit c
MKMLKVAGLVVVFLLVAAVPAFAQGTDHVSYTFAGSGLAAGLGMGLTIIGAGWGMGRIGSAAVESMARQPEVAARVQTAMIIIAAMLEGATLASVILCYLVAGAAKW